MAITTPSRPATTERSRPRGLFAWTAALRHALDRPLTSYYLLLGASALLLTIGLIMVLSASSVYSFRVYDDSYAIVEKQLLWVVIGVPCMVMMVYAMMRLFKGVKRLTGLETDQILLPR